MDVEAAGRQDVSGPGQCRLPGDRGVERDREVLIFVLAARMHKTTWLDWMGSTFLRRYRHDLGLRINKIKE